MGMETNCKGNRRTTKYKMRSKCFFKYFIFQEKSTSTLKDEPIQNIIH